VAVRVAERSTSNHFGFFIEDQSQFFLEKSLAFPGNLTVLPKSGLEVCWQILEFAFCSPFSGVFFCLTTQRKPGRNRAPLSGRLYDYFLGAEVDEEELLLEGFEEDEDDELAGAEGGGALLTGLVAAGGGVLVLGGR